jgi:hypothetical protein
MKIISMKRFLYIILFSCLVSSACKENLLETIPNDRISTEIFWKSIEDAEFAANGVYATLGGLRELTFDGLTDILITNRGFDENLIIQRGFGTAGSSRFLSDWQHYYRGIARANYFLENVDRIVGANAQVIDRMKGEVMVIRAYHYLRLVALFGDVPFFTTTLTVEAGRSITRTSKEEIYDFLETDLQLAATYLPNTNGARIKKATALGLLSRAMLYAGRFEKAANAALPVIQDPNINLYPSYFGLFQYAGEGSSEVLLDRQFARDINSHNIYATYAPWSQIAGSNGSMYVPSSKIVDMFPMQNGKNIEEAGSGFDPFNPYVGRDPRLEASIFLDGITPLPGGGTYGTKPGVAGSDRVQIDVHSTATGFNVRKYVANEDYVNPGNSGLNIILLRYAEVLLNYAEAKIELNQIDASVYSAINELRSRQSVNLPPISAADGYNQASLRTYIRQERSVELAFEGHRLFDLRRWRTAAIEIPGNVTGMTYVEDGTIKQVQLPGFDRNFNNPRDYLWPIPSRERELNSNLSQNDDW